MLAVFYDFFPVLLFFLAFKWYGIYVATLVGIVMTAAQVIGTLIVKKTCDKKQLITLAVFIVFGGLTLYFHNPLFIKWKPTIIFWIFGVLLFGSQFLGQKPLSQRMLEHLLEKQEIPRIVWIRLNIAWMAFFILLGFLNIYIAYRFSTEAWVNFKFYGILGALLAFSFFQAMYLSRYMSRST